MAKKSSRASSVTYAEAIDVALCYGWIDGQKKSESEQHWLQRFVPRKGRSIWSKINREKALSLIARGEMKPAGLKEIERAKGDGGRMPMIRQERPQCRAILRLRWMPTPKPRPSSPL